VQLLRHRQRRETCGGLVDWENVAMQIQGTTHIHGPHGANAPHFAQRAPGARPGSQADGADRVDISPAAEAAVQAAETGGIRQELVDNIRARIAAGSYETPGKLEAAVERMLDQII
jgi:negative regulator of flagellin synthesis FlgM